VSNRSPHSFPISSAVDVEEGHARERSVGIAEREAALERR
jgi:hypothetical protein